MEDTLQEIEQFQDQDQQQSPTQQQDPPSKGKKLYQNLLKEGYTVKNLGSEDDFIRNLSDKTKADKFYNNLINDGYNEANLGKKDEFVNSFTPLKKKDGTQLSAQALQSGGSVYSPTQSQSNEDPIYKAAQDFQNMVKGSLKKAVDDQKVFDPSKPVKWGLVNVNTPGDIAAMVQFPRQIAETKAKEAISYINDKPKREAAAKKAKEAAAIPITKAFQLPDKVQFNPDILDSEERKEYDEQTKIPLAANKSNTELVKQIVDRRNDPEIMAQRGKSFLQNDMQESGIIPIQDQNGLDVGDYYNRRNEQIDDELNNIKGHFAKVGFNKNPDLIDKSNLSSEDVQLQDHYNNLIKKKQELNKYANAANEQQALQSIDPAQFQNKSDYYKAIGKKIQSVDDYESILKKDADPSKVNENDSFNWEAAGIEASKRNLIDKYNKGQVDDITAHEELNKLNEADRTLDKRHPEVALDNIRKFMGEYIATKRKEKSSGLESFWHNTISASPNWAEAEKTIRELKKQGVQINEDQAKKILSDLDKIPLTSVLGHVYHGSIAKASMALNNWTMDSKDAEKVNSEREKDFRDPSLYMPQQPTELPVIYKKDDGSTAIRMTGNKRAGETNWGWATVNNVGEVTGTILNYALLNKGFGALSNAALGGVAGTEVVGATNAIGRIKNITQLSTQQRNLISNVSSSTFLNYHENLERAKEITNNPVAQQAFATVKSLVTGFVFAGINPNKVMGAVEGTGEKKIMERFINEFKATGKMPDPTKFKDLVKDMVIQTGKDLGHNVSLIKADQIAGLVLEGLTNKKSLDNRDLSKEIIGSLPSDIISFIPFSVIAGVGKARANKAEHNAVVDAVRMAVQDVPKFEANMQANVEAGKISQQDAQQKIDYVKSVAEKMNGKDINNERFMNVSPEKRVNYANNLVRESRIKDDIKNMTDDIQISDQKKKAEDLQNERKNILLQSELGNKEFKDLNDEEKVKIEPPKEYGKVIIEKTESGEKYYAVLVDKDGNHTKLFHASKDTPDKAKIYGEEKLKEKYFDENIKDTTSIPKEADVVDVESEQGIPIGDNVPEPTNPKGEAVNPTLKDIEEVYNKIDFGKKNQIIDINGNKIERIVSEGSADYYFNGEEIPYLSSNMKGLSREERIDLIKEEIDTILSNKEKNKDKKSYSFRELENHVKDVLDKKGIKYKYQKALNSDSGYFETDNGTIRISDHTGNFRNYDHVSDFIFTDTPYGKSEIENRIEQSLSTKPEIATEVKEGFTEAKDLNKIYADLKAKYGDKKGAAIYEVANRLVNPNKNTIVEIRSNGVVVKEGDKYILKPFGNTDANMKKWTLYKGLDVTDQFTKQSLSKQESGGKAPVTKPEGKSDVVPPTEQQSGKDGKVAPDAELGIQQGYAKKAMTDFINSPDMGYSIHEEGGKTALGLSEAQVRSANGLKGGDRMQSHEHTNIELTKDEKKQLNKIESDKELGDIDGLEYAKQKRALAKKIFERASNELQQKANEQSGKDVVVDEGVVDNSLKDVETVAKKHFSDEAILSAKEAENNNEGVLINMPIDDFLSLNPKGDNADKRATVSKLVKEGTKFNEIPFLNFTHDGNGNAEVTGHEGRHRAMELKAQGETTIPVLLRNRAGGQGEVNINKESISDTKNFNEDLNPNAEKFPTKLRGHLEQKNVVIDFPLKEQSLSTKPQVNESIPTTEKSEAIEIPKQAESEGVVSEQADKVEQPTEEEIEHTINFNKKTGKYEVVTPKGSVVAEVSTEKEAKKIKNNIEEALSSEQPTEEAKLKIESEHVEPEIKDGVYVDPKRTILSHRGLQEVATEFGLEDVVPRDRVTDKQLQKEAEITTSDWIKNGNYDKNIEELLIKGNRGEPVSAEQRLILQQYLANVREKTAKVKAEFGINSKEYDAQLAELSKLKETSQRIRSSTGAALRIPDIASIPDNTLEGWMNERKESASVDILTEKQKEEVQKQHEDFEQKTKDANEKLSKANEEISKLKAELELANVKDRKYIVRKKSRENLQKERAEIIGSIKDKLKKSRGETTATILPYANELFAIAPDVKRLVRNLVDTGTSKLADVIDKVFDVLKDSMPDINKKDVRDIIAGEYNEKLPPKKELERQLEELRVEAKLINKLEAILRGEEPKNEKAKIERNQNITDLRKKIKDLETEKREAAKKPVEKKSEEDIALETIKKRNESESKKIEERIKNKQFETEKKIPIDENVLLKKANPKLYKETMDAIVAKNEAKNKFDLAKRQDELSKRSFGRKTLDFGSKLISTSKAIKAGIDDSITFIQLGMAVMANPKAGVKAKWEALQDAASNKRFKRELAALHNSPYWNVIEKSGLDITEPKSANKEKLEETFSGNLLDTDFKIKGKRFNAWTHTGGIFERLFTSMGNNMRLNMFTKRMEMLQNEGKTFDIHPQEYKDAARVINELTGRGKMNTNIASANPIITPIIWAPKMLSSSFNLLGISDLVSAPMSKEMRQKVGTQGLYRTLTPSQRKYAFSQMGKGIGMGIAVGAAFAMNGWDFDADPRSVTFGQISNGQKSYNVFGRYANLTKTIVQLITGHKKTPEGEQDLDKRGRGGALRAFFRGKETPFAGLVTDYWLNSQKNFYTQKPITLESLPAELIEPISISEMKKALDQDGTLGLLTRWLPAFEGIQVSDVRDIEKPSSFTKEELENKDLKYLVDKEVKLPVFDPKQIPIKELQPDGKGIEKKLSDFDEPKQIEYINNAKKYFNEEFEKLKSKNYVYINRWGNISYSKDLGSDDSIPDKDETSKKKTPIEELNKEQLQIVVGDLKEKASDRVKKELFPKEYKK